MIPSLRKKHRIIWLILAFLLPILFILSIIWLPQEVYQEELFQETEVIDAQDLKIQ